ncbi:STAS domain-containing protein [Pseudonocardia acidicola]|uniref:Anti-sigma factor antagonist n=1 Tax=Pseudonocardia acidicola TaxID=2724939 RepID=A0ABX1SD51_9PSEU|nr:STAS domain-containing protein [Pseudonocardia acidicola]NMH99501.1 STAS domain-containing protein [Pseudonocardia acidicola]
MTLVVGREGDAVVVVVGGEIDLVTGARLGDTLTAELTAGPKVLVVDLEQVRFFTSVGLTALALAQRMAQERGVDLRVVATTRTTLRPLQITGMVDDLAIYPSRTDALSGCSGAEPGSVPPQRSE